MCHERRICLFTAATNKFDPAADRAISTDTPKQRIQNPTESGDDAYNDIFDKNIGGYADITSFNAYPTFFLTNKLLKCLR